MTLGITYNPYPQTMGILAIPEALLYNLWTIFEQMTMKKFLSDAFGENTTWRRAAVQDLFHS